METVTRYGAQVADALAHAHDRGIVASRPEGFERDGNARGRVKVLDFGLATRLGNRGNQRAHTFLRLAESKLVGTLPYIAPEVLRGQKGDHLSDLWALGVLLYELAAGSLRFANTGRSHVGDSARASSPLPPTVAAGPRSSHSKMSKQGAPGRYQRASEVRVALEAVQGAVLQSRRPLGRSARTPDAGAAGMEHLA